MYALKASRDDRQALYSSARPTPSRGYLRGARGSIFYGIAPLSVKASYSSAKLIPLLCAHSLSLIAAFAASRRYPSGFILIGEADTTRSTRGSLHGALSFSVFVTFAHSYELYSGDIMDILGNIMNDYGLYAGLVITFLCYITYFGSGRGGKSKGSPVLSFARKILSLLSFLWFVLIILGIFYELKGW